MAAVRGLAATLPLVVYKGALMNNDGPIDDAPWTEAPDAARARLLLHAIVVAKKAIALDRSSGAAATAHPAGHFAEFSATAALLTQPHREPIEESLRGLLTYAANAFAQLQWSKSERAVLDAL
jgi:hypothetical protein